MCIREVKSTRLYEKRVDADGLVALGESGRHLHGRGVALPDLRGRAGTKLISVKCMYRDSAT
jgi:hypothetical protein